MKKTKCLILFILFWGFVILGTTWYFEINQSSRGIVVNGHPTHSTNPLIKYCNIPASDNLGGKEGLLNDNHKLVGVIALFRHGDRGPLASIINGSKPINCSSHVGDRFKTLESLLKDKKQYRSILPQSDYCKPGILTKQGSSQLIELGYSLKSSYEEYFRFSDARTINNIETYSTPYSRTIQSLSSFLYGLIGFKLFLNVSVFSQADVPFCFSYCRCEAANQYEKKHKHELRQHFDEKNETGNFPFELETQHRELFSWSQKRALPSTIKDVLLSYVCHQEIPPCNAKGVCLNSNFGTTLHNLLDHEALVSAQSLNLKKAAVLRAYGLLKIIDNRINSWIRQYKKHLPTSNTAFPKLLVFSGHDLTLMYALTALSLYDGFLPKYASRLVIEVYTDEVHYFSRVFWNGEDVTQNIPICFTPNRRHKRCSARFLSKLVQNEMSNLFNTQNFEEACSWQS